MEKSESLKRPCKKCGGEHPVFYHQFTDGSLHLAMICHDGQWHYLKREPGLSIPIRPSKKLELLEAEIEERHQMMDKECDLARDKDRTMRPVYCRDCYEPMWPTINKAWNRPEQWTCRCGRTWRRVNENHWESNR